MKTFKEIMLENNILKIWHKEMKSKEEKTKKPNHHIKQKRKSKPRKSENKFHQKSSKNWEQTWIGQRVSSGRDCCVSDNLLSGLYNSGIYDNTCCSKHDRCSRQTRETFPSPRFGAEQLRLVDLIRSRALPKEGKPRDLRFSRSSSLFFTIISFGNVP